MWQLLLRLQDEPVISHQIPILVSFKYQIGLNNILTNIQLTLANTFFKINPYQCLTSTNQYSTTTYIIKPIFNQYLPILNQYLLMISRYLTNTYWYITNTSMIISYFINPLPML